jgi:ribonuclease VapC
VIAIDSSALIAILRLEPDADVLLRAIVGARGRVLSALNLLESSMVLAGHSGGGALWEPLEDFLSEARIEIAPFDAEQARYARAAFTRYGKGRHPAALNLGDCAAYALAKSRNLPLLFKGNDFPKTDVMAVL